MPSLNDHSRSLVKNLIRASENGEPLAEIDEHVTLCALDIVCGTYVLSSGSKLRLSTTIFAFGNERFSVTFNHDMQNI
jgi:hypothetical protein